jgi:hypothetical protein
MPMTPAYPEDQLGLTGVGPDPDRTSDYVRGAIAIKGRRSQKQLDRREHTLFDDDHYSVTPKPCTYIPRTRSNDPHIPFTIP